MALDPQAVAAALRKAAPDNLPDVDLAPDALTLRYADAAAFGARCSADDAAVRALKGARVLGAEQSEDGPAIAIRYALGA